jgi:hypothetical protein
MSQNAMYDARAAGGADAGDTMPLGRLAVRAQISVTFDMEPAGAKH